MATSDKSFPRNITGCLTCIQVLNIMVFTGFMLNYALRVNLTIALVAMVIPAENTTENLINNATAAAAANVTKESGITQTRFTWDTYQTNMMLGSFYWGYILTELPGGRLAETIGARRVFGYSMLAAALLTLVTPGVAMTGAIGMVLTRALLGFSLGATWPAMHPLTAVWIPPLDRSKFIANMMASSLGAAVTMPICGFLISNFGWESSFYVTGALGLIWALAWFAVVHDSPSEHPRISAEERNAIEKAIGSTSTSKSHGPVPWKRMLLSGPVWAIIITHGMSVFGYFTIFNQLPTYMKTILHYDIKANGLLSSLPYLGKYLFALISSHIADYVRRTGRMTTTFARKFFTTFAVGTPAILMLAQVFLGYDRIWSTTILTIALTLNGAVTAGYLGNGLDIAPNFSGTIFGMANTLSSIGGFLSTFMVGYLTYSDKSYHQWQIVFGILALTYFIGTITYLFLGSGELQDWNDLNGENDKAGMNGKAAEEMVPLKEKLAA